MLMTIVSQREKHVDCTYDLYLQAYAKRRLLPWFENAPHINVHYIQKQICVRADGCRWQNDKTACCVDCEQVFDIKRACKQLEYIKLNRTTSLSSTSYYRLLNPDRPNNDINIVIRACEEKDKERDDLPSGRVIELWIDSENDIDTFIGNYNLQTNQMVRYHGFTPRSSRIEIQAKVLLMRFTLYKSGRINILKDVKCNGCDGQIRDGWMQITINPDTSAIKWSKLANWGMAIASGEPFNHKFCAMCKKRHFQDRSFCCKLTGEIHKLYDNADACKDYEADSDWINKMQTAYKKHKQTYYADYWVGDL